MHNPAFRFRTGWISVVFLLSLLISMTGPAQAGLDGPGDPPQPDGLLGNTVVDAIASTPAVADYLSAHVPGSAPIFGRFGGSTWDTIINPPWGTGAVPAYALVATPRTFTGSPMRIVLAYAGPGRTDLHTYRSGDYGRTWAVDAFPYNPACTEAARLTGLSASPADPNRLYLTYTCAQVSGQVRQEFPSAYTSTDAGLTYTPISVHSTSPLLPSPILPQRVYEGYRYYSDNAGAQWLNTNFPATSLPLLLDGKDPLKISEFGPSARSTADGGKTWTPWAANPCPSDALQASTNPNLAGALYLRCPGGLYRSLDLGAHWQQLSVWHGRWIGPDYSRTPAGLLWARDDGLWRSADNGSTWQQVTGHFGPLSLYWENRAPADPVGSPQGLALLTQQNAWAISQEHAANGALLRSWILHWNGREWSRSPTSLAPSGIAFDGAQNGWIVGNGSSLHWNGSAWQAFALPGAEALNAVDVIGSQAWSAGAQGKLLEWNGSAWKAVISPTSLPLTTLTARTASDVWAGGGITNSGGTFTSILLHRNAQGWSISRQATDGIITGISALDAQNVWAVLSRPGPQQGTILHWNGSSWQAALQVSDSALYAISMASATDGWVLGSRHLYHWNGTLWQPLALSENVTLAGRGSIANLGPSNYWMAGTSAGSGAAGVLFQYTLPRIYTRFLPLIQR